MISSANTIEETPITDGNVFVDHVINAILAIRKNSKRPGNISILSTYTRQDANKYYPGLHRPTANDND